MERFDVVEQEQLAAQIVALMDAHFQRPTVEQKIRILNLAHQQMVCSLHRIEGGEELNKNAKQAPGKGEEKAQAS